MSGFRFFDPLRPVGRNCPCGIDGRKLPSSPPPPQHPTPVEAWPVTRANERLEYLPTAEKDMRIQEGKIAYAFDPRDNRDYLVAEDAFDLPLHAQNLFRYESRQALARIEHSCRLLKSPDLNQQMEVFRNIESAVITRLNGHPKNFRHLSFLLRELSGLGCDLPTATAALLHFLPRKEAERIITAGQKSSRGFRELTGQILDIVEVFREINEIHYSPPHKKLRHHIQNFMDALIKCSRGNGRALLLFFVHKLSALTQKTEDAGDIDFKSVEEFIAPSAERLGLILLASKLRNEALRLHDPELYQHHEDRIVKNLGVPRKQAEESLEEIRKSLEEALSQAKCGMASTRCRVKTPWGVKAKSESKAEYRLDHSELLLMEDLRACQGITRSHLILTEAKKIVRQTLGKDFSRFDEEQTETQFKQVQDNGAEIHHITAVLQNGDSIEFQFMTEEDYRKIEKGYLSHWAYKLELLTKQQFDRDFLEECAAEMSGKIINDAEVIYQHLKPWIYVFFRDPSDKETPLRVIRRPIGSLPLDVVHLIIGPDISTYGGATKKKIWNLKDARVYRAEEDEPLKDGDFIELLLALPGSRDYLTPTLRKKLASKVKVLRTKYLLHFFNNEDKIDEATAKGVLMLYQATGRPIHRLSGFEDFAVQSYNMTTGAVLASIGQGLISSEEIFNEYQRFIRAGLASR